MFQERGVSVKEKELAIFEILTPEGNAGADSNSNFCEAEGFVFVVGKEHRIEGGVGVTMTCGIEGTLVRFALGSEKTEFCGGS